MFNIIAVVLAVNPCRDVLPSSHAHVPCVAVSSCGSSPPATVTDFLNPLGTAPPSKGHTSVSICHNESHLNFMFDCKDDNVNSTFPRGCYTHCGRGDPRGGPAAIKDCIFEQSSTELFLSAGIADDGKPSGLNWELDMGARGAMYINQNQSPNGTCDSNKHKPDNYFLCNSSVYETLGWRTKVDQTGWKANYEIPYEWIAKEGKQKYYRANFHRNGPLAYQSSWSNAQNNSKWTSFHCPYIFGVLVLV
jgi:hypothetical protein